MAKWDHDDLRDVRYKSDYQVHAEADKPKSPFDPVAQAIMLGQKPSSMTTVLPTKVRGSDLQPQTDTGVRTFGTGATRDLDANKLDFEGFLSPLVLERYAQHMHRARKMPDGSMRDSDNWQLGIPKSAYMKSMFRHFFDVWKRYRNTLPSEHVGGDEIETELCALLFNANGMLHEILKAKRAKSEVY